MTSTPNTRTSVLPSATRTSLTQSPYARHAPNGAARMNELTAQMGMNSPVFERELLEAKYPLKWGETSSRSW